MPMVRSTVAALVIIPCVILLLPVFVVSMIFMAFVSAVRAIGGMLEPSFMSWTELIEYHPSLGWKPRPHLDGHYLAIGDDVFRVVTDNEGWPGERSLDQSEVVIIGDSFAFGYGIDADRTFATLIRDVQVKAVGAPGYSMVQGVLLIEQFGGRLKGKLAVWFVFPENDLQDNLAPEMRGYRAPFARFNRGNCEWEIVASHIGPRKWQCSNLDVRRLFPKLCVPGVLADRAYSASDYLLGRAQSACRRVGAELVIVTIPYALQLTRGGRESLAALSGNPDLFDADLPDHRIAESCRRYRLPLVAGKEHLSRADYKRREAIHWTQQGHRRMAGLVRQLHTSFQSGSLDQHIPPALGDPALHVVPESPSPIAVATQSAAAGGVDVTR